MTVEPKRKDRRRLSHDEGAAEPRGPIDKEATDIETENPIDDAGPVEQVEEEADMALPLLEE